MGDGAALIGVWRVRYDDGRRSRAGGTYRNVACVNGKSYLAALLNLEGPLLSGATIYGAVGTGTATPQSTDTALATELARVALATNSRLNNVVTMDFYFNTSQGNGTLTEAGLFLGASGGAGSGSLLSHVAISEAKTSAVTMTLEFSLQIG